MADILAARRMALQLAAQMPEGIDRQLAIIRELTALSQWMSDEQAKPPTKATLHVLECTQVPRGQPDGAA